MGLLPALPWWELVLRAVAIYVALLLALRLFGKREVGQFTLYDLVFVLLVANALQPAITGPDTSVVGGLILIVALAPTMSSGSSTTCLGSTGCSLPCPR